jgi:Ca2+-binding RTX toxin-like protein
VRPALLAITGLLLSAPGADAAIVQLRPLPAEPGTVAEQLQVTRLPGEVNALALAQPGDGTVVVTDTGASLFAGRGCAGGAGEVRCTVPPGAQLQVVVTGGTLDGSVSLAAMKSYARGELWGGSGREILSGGPGSDDLFGGAGDDELAGGAGDDRLDPGPGTNVLRGGPGEDLAWYSADVRQTIILGGALGNGDDVGIDVENVTADEGDDRIVGSDLANVLEGGTGADEIDGRGGDDVISAFGDGSRLVGGAGRDRIAANDARAWIDVRDGEADRVRCRPGLARPPLADANDRLAHCVPVVRVRTRRARVDASGRLLLSLACRAVEQPCLVRLRLRHRGSELARRSVRAPDGTTSFAMRLHARGRRLLERRDEIRVCVRALSYRTTPAPSEGWPGCWPVEMVRAP